MSTSFQGVVDKYLKNTDKTCNIPKASFGPSELGKVGLPAKFVLACLFQEQALTFLQESSMRCRKYKGEITLCKNAGVKSTDWHTAQDAMPSQMLNRRLVLTPSF
jgi:hypothetical protein